VTRTQLLEVPLKPVPRTTAKKRWKPVQTKVRPDPRKKSR